tara:strand:+ start:2363 stop:3676 length:1314 start_codon:yes stop_codon:yes gene_type:complete
MTNASKKSEAGNITKADVTSNSNSQKSVGLTNGILRLTYYESILQDSVKAFVVYGDVGNAIDQKSAVEGLPIIGTEDFRLEFEDNNENKIKVDMVVNSVTPIYEDTNKNVVSLELVSEEYIRNEMGESRLRSRFDGNITANVEKIFKDRLKTKKPLDLEDTSNEYSFLGNGRKPYYMLNLLSKQSIPEGGEDGSAGFLFFETADGYQFKSIDKLFDNPQKKSYIFNNSTDTKAIPPGYDGKILEQQSDNSVNVQSKMNIGAYKTKLVMFDPYNCKYVVEEKTADEAVTKKKVKLAGKKLPKFNSKFDSPNKDYTRTTFMMVDSGTLPSGSTETQIQENQKDNFKAAQTLNQAIRRYNQLFSSMMEITIAGDFSLHAGDVIFVDIPAIESQKDDTVNRESGGLYIIADLCHFMNADGTFTKLNLARDSFGRKGNHSKR